MDRRIPQVLRRLNGVIYQRARSACARSVVQTRRQSTIGADGRQWSTPLAKSLGEAITTTGPIPLASYMRQCLTSPEGGYYTRQNEGKDPFGTKGDFITSPEISQVFGELIGLWIVAEWMAQGKPWGTHIIELGPGRGTLMSDVLRTVANFKSFKENLTDVIMVEASPSLRKAQHALLCGDNQLEDWCQTNQPGCWKSKSKLGVGNRIEWYEELKHVPRNEAAAPFIIAHEFFDALPIHAFQAVPTEKHGLTRSTSEMQVTHKTNEWRELLVTPASPFASSVTKFGTSSQLTAPSKSFESSATDDKPEFTLITSKIPTAHSKYLPTTSDRYKKILHSKSATIEISPESQLITAEIAQRIGGSNTSTHKRSGAALILDYGPADTIPANSLRGIRNHKLVSPFVSPGDVDLSADVDFMGLAETALEASPGVEVHGPVEQAAFLGAMGIVERTRMLTKAAEKKGDTEAAKRIGEAMDRLVDRGARGMGKVYKALAVLPYVEDGAVRRPVGFGGDL